MEVYFYYDLKSLKKQHYYYFLSPQSFTFFYFFEQHTFLILYQYIFSKHVNTFRYNKCLNAK